ncbi:MAG: sugar ABC transporter ATP-binding protein [Kosmotoga sp.]|nr:MAG: sugar ABC transporter ATP-binding protein [Kosmotoga sp.]
MVNLLEIRNLKKSFKEQVVLDNLNFEVLKGEIHGLVGRNFSGKSTIAKIISGVLDKDEGELIFEGESVKKFGVQKAFEKGISMVFQEFASVPDLTVAENMFLGKQMSESFGMISKKHTNAKANEVISKYELPLNPQERVFKLDDSKKKFVELASALVIDPKLLIIDEITHLFDEQEKEMLYKIISKLKSEDRSVIFISQNLQEVLSLCDRVSVIRNKEIIETEDSGKMDKEKLVELMLDKKIVKIYPEKVSTVGEPLLEVKELDVISRKISFTLHKGEILGINDLNETEKNEVVKALYRKDPDRNEIPMFRELNKLFSKLSAQQTSKADVGHFPRTMRGYGMAFAVALKDDSKPITVNKKLGKLKIADKMDMRLVKKLLLEMETPETLVGQWIEKFCSFIIFIDPSKGLDPERKRQLYHVMNHFTSKGKGIILISSNKEEIQNMCNKEVE